MKIRLLTAVIAILAAVALQAAGTYSTSFPASENPISEGGRWINGKANGMDWSNVTTTPGLAIGTQSGSGWIQRLSGHPPRYHGDQPDGQRDRAFGNQTGGNVFEEVEILLRFSIGSHVARGYEINFRSMNSSESYTQIVRWNGALGSFTEIDGRGGTGYGIREGDP